MSKEAVAIIYGPCNFFWCDKMLSLEVGEFIQRWRSKADGIDLADLAGYFDKFPAAMVVGAVFLDEHVPISD